MNYKVKPITVAVGAVMTACLAGTAFADTEEDPFALEDAGDGYDLLADAHGAEGECGDEGKCGEGKCGDEGGDGDGDGDADEESGDGDDEETAEEEASADE